MTSLNIVASLLFMAMAVSAGNITSGPGCDFMDFEVNAAVSRLLAKMPVKAEVFSQRYKTIVPGLEVGGLRVEGLHKLRQFGAAIPFYVDGSCVVQVDVINAGRVFLSMPWRTCSGKKGIIQLTPMMTRSTLLLELIESDSGSGDDLRFREMAPVATEDLFIGLSGTGSAVVPITKVLSKMFDGVLRMAWNSAFYPAVVEALS